MPNSHKLKRENWRRTIYAHFVRVNCVLIKMKKKNFIIYGMVLVFIAYLLLLCALYVLQYRKAYPIPCPPRRTKQEGHGRRKVIFLNGQDKVLVDQVVRPSGLTGPAGIPLESKGKVRAARNEGTLWINRKLSQCLIALGTTHGLEKGVLVDIYDGKKKVGEARVIQVFDVISYAELTGNTQEHFTKNYYSVSVP